MWVNRKLEKLRRGAYVTAARQLTSVADSLGAKRAAAAALRKSCVSPKKQSLGGRSVMPRSDSLPSPCGLRAARSRAAGAVF